MFGLGAGELLIILVFALLFIGPKKLPELAKSLGKGLREFQKAKDDLMDHINHPPADNITDQSTTEETKAEAIEGVEIVAETDEDEGLSNKEHKEEQNRG